MNDRAYPPITQTARIVRITLLVMFTVLVVLLLLLVRNHPPTEDSIYPGCMLYRTTGIHCMGCGLTRSVHSTLNGEISQSIAWHPLAFILLPLLIISVSRSLIHWAMGTTHVTATSWLSRWSLKVLVVVLVLFMVSRNLPWYPFTLLAPHELPK